MANIYELLADTENCAGGHGGNSVLNGNQDRFIDLEQFTMWLGKTFIVPALSHMYVSELFCWLYTESLGSSPFNVQNEDMTIKNKLEFQREESKNNINVLAS